MNFLSDGKEYIDRCRNAWQELSKIAVMYAQDGNTGEYLRITSKMDGLSLAISYYEEMFERNQQ